MSQHQKEARTLSVQWVSLLQALIKQSQLLAAGGRAYLCMMSAALCWTSAKPLQRAAVQVVSAVSVAAR